ncbi:Multisubunit Na+/H+ antiporter, MnhB subunit [Hyphomicrobiales bacterium]|nr:Multisubunit Na+/H+ antiporter, MnhB subunit [Hyphomicrobiales bacterium]CAH1698776.1 Multisubunit Na+/H+ antiporter, MnhB subunit [Hyphomicrobiales bacterium]CAI0342423.1 multicomponent Na+:H+ antiporter subunit B [Hyphomicrobiales bacterium]
MMLLLDLALVAWLLALAVHVVAQPDDRNAIIAFLAFGLLLGLGWVRLAAPDVALTEIAIGGGATGILLLRAEAALRGRGKHEEATTPAGKLAVAAGCAAISAGLAFAVLTFASPAPTLAPAASEALGATGLGNPVTAVLLAYRALDTLLEKVVVLLALVGVWSLAPDGAWGGAPEVRSATVPEPLAWLARILPPFGVVIGVYMFWVGADAPGGTFQAGTVLAAMWLLVMMAGIHPPPDTARPLLLFALTGGPALFLAIAFLGFAFAAGFLAYPEGLAKPFIVAIEAALTLSVAAALAMLVAGPAGKAPAR